MTDDLYNDVMLRRWSLDLSTGRQECLEDAVDIGGISAEDRSAIEAKNADIHGAIEAVETFEAEQPQEADTEILALAALRRGDASQEQLDLVAATWGYEVTVMVGPQGDAVNAERERRIEAGAVVAITGVGPVPVQGRDTDIRNLQGLGMAALARIMGGDHSTITSFRDANNEIHDLVPAQVFELWQKAAKYAQDCYAASWTIKAMTPVPADFAADGYWPAR